MATLNMDSPVSQWVLQHPQTSRVFEDLQIDYCCGGNVELSKASDQKQLDATAVMEQLSQIVAATTPDPDDNWKDAKLSALCGHIEQTHHAYLRQELPRLSALVDKVASAHGANHSELTDIQRVLAELRAELEPHMMKEEQVLFPAIRALEEAVNRPSFPFGTVANPIRMMEHEHDNAGTALGRIRAVVNNFQPPEDACNTYRVMLDALHDLERNMHQHVHKENNILFPRAQQLEASLETAGA